MFTWYLRITDWFLHSLPDFVLIVLLRVLVFQLQIALSLV